MSRFPVTVGGADTMTTSLSTATAVIAALVLGCGSGRRGPGLGVVGATTTSSRRVEVGSASADEAVEQAPGLGDGQRDELVLRLPTFAPLRDTPVGVPG